MTATSTSSPTSNPVVLSLRNLRKAFGAVTVLQDIDLEIRAGEVLALLGENGAGKSTLVKILAGFESVTAGELLLHAVATEGNVRVDAHWQQARAEAEGVILIHQELNLVEQLTVAENIFLGHERTRGPFLDKFTMRRLTREYLAALECDIDPDTPMHTLAVSAKQMVEIAKTQSKQARVLILDEPTAVLTQKESQVLFALIERLRQQGVAIVYISHKLDEIAQIADRITILRDGTLVGHYAAQDLSQDDMARLMVGRELSDLFPPRSSTPDYQQCALRVTRLLVAGTNTPVSFELQRGEILGFAGLVGSGRTALLETVVGLRAAARANTGSLEVADQPVVLRDLATARRHNIAYLTKDRKGSGLLLDKGLVMNFSLFALSNYAGLLIHKKQEEVALTAAVDAFDIRIKDANVLAGNLSGGNQQKLLLAKMLAAKPSVLIFDEPTRGIDIGTKGQIYQFINQLAASGHSIILISSDITEIIGLSDRVAVMYHGELTGILKDDEIEEHEIMRYATGLKSRQQIPVPIQRVIG